MNADIRLMFLKDVEEAVARQADRVVVLKVGDRGIFGGGAIEANDRPALFRKVSGGIASDEARDSGNKNGLCHGFTPRKE